MKLNTSENLDILVKKIYQSYIDIKTDEFELSNKELLLGDIRKLHTIVESLGVSESISVKMEENNKTEIHEVESPISNKVTELESIDLPSNTIVNTESTIEIKQPTDLTSTLIEKTESSNVIEEVKPEITSIHSEWLPKNVPIKELEIALTEPVNEISTEKEAIPIQFEEKKIEVQNIPSLKVEEAIVPSIEVPTIMNNLKEVENDKNSESPNIIEKLIPEEPKKEEKIVEILNEPLVEPPKIQPQTTISSTKIIDFLHQDHQPKREIFDFIDINTRIGLVEIFFKGNSVELSECLSNINHQNTLDESVNIMNSYAEKFKIAKKSDIYQTFLNIIQRKFYS